MTFTLLKIYCVLNLYFNSILWNKCIIIEKKPQFVRLSLYITAYDTTCTKTTNTKYICITSINEHWWKKIIDHFFLSLTGIQLQLWIIFWPLLISIRYLKKNMLIIIVNINQHIHISNHIQLPRFFLTVAIQEKTPVFTKLDL